MTDQELMPWMFESSPIYDSIMSELAAMLEDEMSRAVDVTHTPETRAHACGRTSAVMEILTTFKERREFAVARRENA